ncbi:MAG: helix-turn-helix domain-containing protein [Defluviitaleaceae bacterium]|nr:helix-turn-helix domain-containing protein [Defluviitaleaceae bacterium]MCL2274125.1 helix-turn-helix domain-containing protein [Defluviitaleaceae bacterium]
MNICERFKLVRKKAKLNQKTFAYELGISQAHVSGIENGKDKPSSTLIKLICLRFNISEDWLLGESHSMGISYDSFTDEGITIRYKNNRFENDIMHEKRTGDDLKNTYESYIYLGTLLLAAELEKNDKTEYFKYIRLAIDDFEKLIFHVSNGFLPYKNDVSAWLEYKNICISKMDKVTARLKSAVNLYLRKHGENMII